MSHWNVSRPGAGDARNRAIALRAANAREVLSAGGFAWVTPAVRASEWQQLQRYLDAAVISIAVQQEIQALHRQGTRQYGDLVYTNPATQRQIEKAKRSYVPVGKWDDRVRLDHTKLLSADALTPVTDNPDEADYLEQVGARLKDEGVWLRLSPKLVRDRTGWVQDPRQYEVWLTVGPSGDPIPVKKTSIDRAALLGTTEIGAGYYRAVHDGPVEKMLEREMERLSREIASGRNYHEALRQIRDGAFPGVAKVADLLGGATFPDVMMWQEPHKLLIRAMGLRTKGKISGARLMLVVAALATRNAARLLSQYVDGTTSGGATAVQILKVAEIAGAVAGALLLVHGVGVAVARAGAGRAGAVAADATVDALAEREVARYVARNPELAAELNQVRVVAGPKGTVLGNIKGGHSAGHGGGFHQW